MTRTAITTLSAAALLAAGVAGCGGRSVGQQDARAVAQVKHITATTPAPTGEAGPITWALNRAPTSLDPITSYDYAENAVVDSLCEGLLQQQPDLSLKPGLAESAVYPDPHRLVLTLRADARFWDGKPVTAADVVFSLERARDPKGGGYYAPLFDRVTSIKATGDREVTITLSKPDYWLRGELSAMPGYVIEKAYAEKQGKRYGTPRGGVMCSGPFKLKSWQAGGDVVIERNDDYWDRSARAKVSQITFTPIASDATFAAGVATGDVDGAYRPVMTVYGQLKSNPKVTITSGPSLTTDAMVVGNLDGVLGDLRVRRALSLAIDRKSFIDRIYNGQALLPRTSTNPGTWAYARSVFEETSGRQPELTQDLAEAKRLIAQAGVKGQTIVIATVPVFPSIATEANMFAQAAKALGLHPRLETFSPDTYGNLFYDPKARNGVDLFGTLNSPNYADPAPYLATYVTPAGGQNYSGFDDPEITKLLEQARGTADDSARARLAAQADQLVTQQLPWIPIAQPYNVVVQTDKITGAPASYVYENGPWANMIGAAGK